MRSLALVALACLALPLPAAASSLRCPGGLVGEGDARIDLLARCGAPALEERRVIEQLHTDGSAVRVVEDWTYDFGPKAFTHVVTLENGRIVAIARGSRGYRQAPAAPVVRPRARCDHLAGVSEGAGKLDVLERCGEPAFVDAWDEPQGVSAAHEDAIVGERATVRVEVWTYDLGRNRLVRFVRFENGRVAGVTTGSHGYAE